MHERLVKMPQWTTSSRLLKSGEEIGFNFHLPDGVTAGDLTVFPRYLDQAEPGQAFTAGGDLKWLDDLESERIELKFDGGYASVIYQPQAPGNYMARWRAGEEVFHRYFSVIEDDWIVMRFSAFVELTVDPTLHATGIPLDYRLPVTQFDPHDPLFRTFLGYHRHFGDSIIPHFPDAAEMTVDERVKFYGEGLKKVRTLLPDGSDARSARVMMHRGVDPGYGVRTLIPSADDVRSGRRMIDPDFDPGYTQTLMRLGINDHCGLQEANAKPWLGMPEFPYFSSPLDCRQTNQDDGGCVVAHQWDFCGGFHFLGPVSWHYGVSQGQWEKAATCLHQGMREARNLAALSNHPAFLMPLYDGVTDTYPTKRFNTSFGDEALFGAFVERYQREIAFGFTKAYKVVFARSIDIADYYRRHFKQTPRTVFVSKTDHLHYDQQWTVYFNTQLILVPRARIPWETRISTLMNDRRTSDYWKDPLSCEFILVEDQKRQMRFERESPNPIWWFDYTHQERGPEGSTISHVETPDVDVIPSKWTRNDRGLTINLKMRTEAEFDDYAIALWAVPAKFTGDVSSVETNAKECILARNTDGEFHLVLVFDLRPHGQIQVTLREPNTAKVR